MAGGKETPRQKMIGMMYLVLTALLALNVSTTVLEKFIFINDSLQRANAEASERNALTLKGIEAAVEKNQRPADRKFVQKGAELRAKTEETFKQLEDYKLEFIEQTGGYEDPNNPNWREIKGKIDYDGVGRYMMPVAEGGEGHGAKMKEILNKYAAYCRDIVEETTAKGFPQEQKDELLGNLGPIAQDANEDPFWKDEPNQKGKKWSQLAFENAPTHAGLATVSEYEAQIFNYESRVMEHLKNQTGLGFTFDDIKPVVNPIARYVVAGSPYEADMFIAASAKGVTPRMTRNGQPVEVDPTSGVGKVSFTTDLSGGESVGNGVKKKIFKAEITVPSAKGDTTFTSNIEYFVVPPAIVISSATAVSLYRNCANKVRVDVPGLTGNYNPSFSASGGRTVSGSGVGEVNLIPTQGKKFVLTVSNGGQRIGTKEFNVKEIPAPAIRPYANGKYVDLKKGMPAKTNALRIDALADADFRADHGADANFAVTSGVVSLVSAGSAVSQVPFSNGRVNLSRIASQARKGDYLSVEIRGLVRKNFQGKVENFKRFEQYLNIPLY